MGAAMSGEGEAGTGGFLDRWSRRKRAVAAPEPEAVAEPPETVARQTVAPDAQPHAVPADEPTPEETAEAIAALPPLEAIDARTDLAPWLRRGVPAALKNAVDYAWDWNTPGGLPGGGGGVTADGVADLLRDLGRDRVAERPAEALAPGDADPLETERTATAVPEVAELAQDAAPDAVAASTRLPGTDSDGPAEEPKRRPEAPAPRPRARRHGGASPA
jgi:hypothetical protein